jgi:hypothetical protein
MKKRLVVILLALAAPLLLALPADASQTNVTGSLVKDQVTYYTTQRLISASGSNIYVQKTDGPHISLKWYKCGNRNVSGAWYDFPNTDPTARIRIGTNFASGTYFCLAAWDHGNNSTDTWSGTVWWNVYS